MSQTPSRPFRGWEYLANKLLSDGEPQSQVSKLFLDSRFPEFTFVPFSVAPKESMAMYADFVTYKSAKLGQEFIQRYIREFDKVESMLGVSREVIASILYIETRFGKATGQSLIINRLARVASVNEPDNVRQNYERLLGTDKSVTYEAVKSRAEYLERIFYPEVRAYLELARNYGIQPLTLKGSIAGAFGMPQFLPSTLIRFGIDGNQDGTISLFNEVDAIWSVANFLASYGYQPDLPEQEKGAVIWHYNRSEAYVSAVLKLAENIRNL